MKTANTVAGILLGLTISCAPAPAQNFYYVPHIDEARTPIETTLQGNELAMPGFGLGSTKTQIIKRLDYAQAHNWLAANQLDQLRSELKTISDKEQSERDASGKLSFENRTELAKQFTDLNDKFELLVLTREQSSPGIDGIKAREAMMIQRINKAVASGKMTSKKAATLKSEIGQTTATLPNTNVNDDESK
ncbi:MAG: hypothetical protein K2X81_17740, partial [Candidatus Obscuribacterales bacterium]|nr:hypothetical protein [Candidatus Obscuribacterales bacterium]